MSINKWWFAATAVAGSALLASVDAFAGLVYLPEENALFQGSGFGSANTLLTLASRGSSSEESGAVFAVGAGSGTIGNAFGGSSQVGLPTLGSLNVMSTADLRIVLNAAEPAGNSITVSDLALTFYDVLGRQSITFSLADPVTLASTLMGVGQAGFAFGLDAADAAAAAAFIGRSASSFADFRVGLSAALNDATGGPETFSVTSKALALPAIPLPPATSLVGDPAATPTVLLVPEPASLALVLAGLGALGLMAARRRLR